MRNSKRPQQQTEEEESDEQEEMDQDDLGFFDPNKRQKIRDKKATEEKWNGFWQLILLISRTVHISTAMITSSLVILNFVFDNF